MTNGLNLAQRFNSRYKINYSTGCWDWVDTLFESGYPRFYGIEASQRAHRASYILNKGSIPKDFDIHHICENKICVNPDHLEAVSRNIHILELTPNSPAYKNIRKKFCIRGHEYTYFPNRRRRSCRTCDMFRMRRKRVQLKAETATAVISEDKRKYN